MELNRKVLLENGFIENTEADSCMFPLIKVISETNDEDEVIYLALSLVPDTTYMVLLLPNGSHLNLNIMDVEGLQSFENAIHSYSPNY